MNFHKTVCWLRPCPFRKPFDVAVSNHNEANWYYRFYMWFDHSSRIIIAKRTTTASKEWRYVDTAWTTNYWIQGNDSIADLQYQTALRLDWIPGNWSSVLWLPPQDLL
jgi:hypothetical protein